MITDSYDILTEPVLSLRDFYGEPQQLVEKCLIIFSKTIYDHLLASYECTEIGHLTACNGSVPVYRFCYRGTQLSFYLSLTCSAPAASCCREINWITGAKQFIMFGSCGSLDREKTSGRYIIPTESYRGEGCSYYYAPPADYITIRNADRLACIFAQLGVPFVKGRVWTTDAMLRETCGLVAKRREEGCIAVEMELAGVQAICDFYGLELYDFLEAGDVLTDNSYEPEGLNTANHDLRKLYIALESALLL